MFSKKANSLVLGIIVAAVAVIGLAVVLQGGVTGRAVGGAKPVGTALKTIDGLRSEIPVYDNIFGDPPIVTGYLALVFCPSSTCGAGTHVLTLGDGIDPAKLQIDGPLGGDLTFSAGGAPKWQISGGINGEILDVADALARLQFKPAAFGGDSIFKVAGPGGFHFEGPAGADLLTVDSAGDVQAPQGNLQLGNPAVRTGITLFDQATGLPFCVVVNFGALAATPGACI